MTERDYKALKKVLLKQEDLSSAVKEFKIASPREMGTTHKMVRRGLVGTVSDIFELTKQMSQDTKDKLPLNNDIIKQFRNTASHRYDIIDDLLAFACTSHCIDKALTKTIKDLIDNYAL